MSNRTIKFRAWTGAKMELDVVGGKLGTFYVKGLDEKDAASMSPFNTIYSDITPVMQFTGLLDKNRVEIFESDKVDGILEGIHYQGFVEWDSEGADYNIVHQDGTFLCAFGLNHMEFSVIGNYYENPELLSEQK